MMAHIRDLAERIIVSVRCPLTLFLFGLLIVQVNGDAAIVNVSYVRSTSGDGASNRQYTSFCAVYNPDLSILPTTEESSVWIPLSFGGDDINLCVDQPHLTNLFGKVLAAVRHNCSAAEHIATASRYNASGLIIVTKIMFRPGQPNTSTGASFSNFPVLILSQRYATEIQKLPFPESWEAGIYGLADAYAVEWSSVILIIVATMVVATGSYRSGYYRYHAMQDHYARMTVDVGSVSQNETERPGVSFGTVAVVVFALFITALLLLMYFFYDYLVYLFIGLFVIGGTSGMFECFRPLVTWNSVVALHIDLSTTWVIFRNASFGWIFLDLLGSFLLVSVLAGIQLPNLKSCTIFLVLLFIYDVFFVFVTPFFTKNGQSVMIQVATGGYDPRLDSGTGHREMIPAAFRVPRIPTGAPCEDVFEDSSYSILGFGDVMVPGFLISYLRGFELAAGMKPIYSISTCTGYLVSLVVTTVALIFMQSGQPALFYIVPVLLIIVFTIAWRRKEIKVLWNGNLGRLYDIRRVENIPETDVEKILPQTSSLESNTGIL